MTEDDFETVTISTDFAMNCMATLSGDYTENVDTDDPEAQKALEKLKLLEGKEGKLAENQREYYRRELARLGYSDEGETLITTSQTAEKLRDLDTGTDGDAAETEEVAQLEWWVDHLAQKDGPLAEKSREAAVDRLEELRER